MLWLDWKVKNMKKIKNNDILHVSNLELIFQRLVQHKQARRNRRTGVSVRRFGIEPDKKCKKCMFCIEKYKKSEMFETGWVEGIKLI